MRHLAGAFTGLLIAATLYGVTAWALAGGVVLR